MRIRAATPGDVAAVRRVARDSWDHDYPGQLSRETVEEGFDEWYGTEALTGEVERPGSRVLVAEDDGDVVGFAHAAWNTGGSEGSILRVYVAPDHRGEDLGRELVDRAAETLGKRGVARITAMVLAENEQGGAFYRSLGFERVDEGTTTIAGEPHEEHVYARE